MFAHASTLFNKHGNCAILHSYRLLSSAEATVFGAEKVSSIFKKLKVGPMKRLYKYYTAGSINLAGGLPMDSTFPIASMNARLNDSSSFEMHRGKDLFLNYHRGDGLPPMKQWIQKHVEELHAPPCNSTDTCITVGSTDAWSKILSLVDSDIVLFDRHAYGAAVNTCESLGKKPIGVMTDGEGMIPSSLKEAVIIARENGMSANLVYFVPVGQNPTGNTITSKRKADLYSVCNELDVIIVEDDAYYYLYFDPHDESLSGIDKLPKSFLSMDTDGRVLRLDSLSKFICPGSRIGWIAGPSDFIGKYLLFQEITAQFPSGISQSLFNGLVTHWGRDGLNNHVKKIQEHYRSQCSALIDALREYMPSQYCSYTPPSGGMFLWLTFHNLGEHNKSLNSFDLFKILCDAGVICVPGDDFLVPDIQSYLGIPTTPTRSGIDVRVTFAASSPEQIRAAVEKMSFCIKRLVDKNV